MAACGLYNQIEARRQAQENADKQREISKKQMSWKYRTEQTFINVPVPVPYLGIPLPFGIFIYGGIKSCDAIKYVYSKI